VKSVESVWIFWNKRHSEDKKQISKPMSIVIIQQLTKISLTRMGLAALGRIADLESAWPWPIRTRSASPTPCRMQSCGTAD
jgi:hypothetical protein